MKSFKIIQVSDPHLSRSHAYFQDNWDVFVDEMAVEKPDMVFVTGDMSLNGPAIEDDLEFARGQMDRLAVPWRAVPGNHDLGETPPDKQYHQPADAPRRAVYRRHFGDDFWVEDLGQWRFIGLNAQLFGGGLPTERTQRRFLERALEERGDRAAALVMHKPLYLNHPDETADSLLCIFADERRDLFELFDRHRVRLVMSGHLHRYRSLRHKGTALIWGPSTAFSILGRGKRSRPGITRLGYLRYQFTGRRFRHELVEPTLFFTIDVRNWITNRGSTIHLPPRPLRQGAR